MPLAPGTRLGSYEILAPIGAGGMGEVYKARDTRLGRDVAIKVSAQQFSERFEREARAIAALNHRDGVHRGRIAEGTLPAVLNVVQFAADGQRFLLDVRPQSVSTAPITVVLNWQAALKK
jgi:serine/threonine protein kinase